MVEKPLTPAFTGVHLALLPGTAKPRLLLPRLKAASCLAAPKPQADQAPVLPLVNRLPQASEVRERKAFAWGGCNKVGQSSLLEYLLLCLQRRVSEEDLLNVTSSS